MSPAEIAARVTVGSWLTSSAAFFLGTAARITAEGDANVVAATLWSGVLTPFVAALTLPVALVLGATIGCAVYLSRTCCTGRPTHY